MINSFLKKSKAVKERKERKKERKREREKDREREREREKTKQIKSVGSTDTTQQAKGTEKLLAQFRPK